MDGSKLAASKDELIFTMAGESVSLRIDRGEGLLVITSKAELMERARFMTNRCLDGIMPLLR
ncbi:hypothetical protein X768_16760 [Mesorhizobium sp. LSJC265A00]|nr:hypothetical protein X768_16760 [Mesorhizobium sp. LSJC265A00]